MATAALPRFSLGKTIGDTFAVTGRNFLVMAGLALLLYGLPSIAYSIVTIATLGGVMANPMAASASLNSIWSTLAIGWLAMLLFYTLANVALTRVALGDLLGNRAGFGEAIAAGFRRFLPVLGITLIVFAAIFALVVALFLAAVVVIGALAQGGAAPAAVLVGILWFFVSLVPVSFLVVVWLVPVPAHIAERTGVFASLGRSWSLTSGHRWKIFAILVLVAFASMFVYGALSAAAMPMMMIEPMAYDARGPAFPTASLLIYSVVQTVVASLVLVIFYALIAAVYVNLRQAKEGLVQESVAEIFS